MFVLIVAALLLPVWGSTSDSGPSAEETICQLRNYCTTLSKGEITAEAGHCVVIPCSFTTDSDFTATNVVWFKCEEPKTKCDDSDVIFSSTKPNNGFKSGFEGRVSLLESDVSKKNCSIIIKDLSKSDSGFYQLRVEGTMSDGRTSGFTFDRKTTVSVKDLTKKPTVMIPPLTEGLQTTLSCSAPRLCSGSVPEITWMWREGENDSHITGNISAVKTDNLRHSSALTLTPSAEHHGTKITCKVSFKNSISTEKTETLNVTYIKDPVIKGKRVVQEGGALSLTCSVKSFPPSDVTWTKPSSNKTLKTGTGTVELIISNMTAEDFGKYICTATHLITNLTAHTEVKAAMKPRILNSSVCEVQSEVLTCVCISQAFPLPTIEWPLLENHTQYCFTSSVSKNMLNTSISVSVKTHTSSPVVCVSKNNFGEVRENLTVIIKNVTEKKDPNKNLLEALKQPQVIVAFLIGLLVSAIICCSVTKCQRKKQTSSGNVSTENLEMMDAAGQTLENGECHGQDRAECEAGAAVQPADEEPREVVYSDINFSLLKRRNPTEAENNQEITKSEYAEIWRDRKTEGRQENGGEDGEMLEGSKEEEVMMVEEERKDCVAEKEEGEDVALYSNVKDLMKEM